MSDEQILYLLCEGVLRVNHETGEVFSKLWNRSERPLGTIHAARGYLRASVRYFGHKYFAMNHRIVCVSAHGLPGFEKAQVNHKNGNRRDNRAENLEWVTDAQNKAHARRLKFYVRETLQPNLGLFDR